MNARTFFKLFELYAPEQVLRIIRRMMHKKRLAARLRLATSHAMPV